jgi:hypothetical protein
MSRCRATKANGEPCTLPAHTPQGVCWAHDPSNREKRRKMASRAAKSKPNREIADAKQHIKDVIADVLAGRVDRNVGSVAFQGYRTLLQAISVELDVQERQEIVREVAELRDIIEANRGANRWGA